MAGAADSSRVLRDFRAYGTLEGLNALLLPAIATYFGWPSDMAGAIVLALANIALIIGLTVGTLFWLAVAARIERNPFPMKQALRVASIARSPMLIIVVAATAGVVALITIHGWSISNDVVALITLLAVLEYVNYYHVQLQHFDNAADLKRLFSGHGFRRSHLARELAKQSHDR